MGEEGDSVERGEVAEKSSWLFRTLGLFGTSVLEGVPGVAPLDETRGL
jgi:hypothetical protein